MSYTTIARINGFPQPTDGLNGNLTITGRTLTHYTVTYANVGSNPYQVGSNFDLLVKAIETIGSIELLGDPTIGTPWPSSFRVAISGAAPAAASGTGNLQGICSAAVSGTTVASFVY